MEQKFIAGSIHEVNRLTFATLSWCGESTISPVTVGQDFVVSLFGLVHVRY